MKTELPRLMLVTQRALMRPSFESALESALRGGARLIQLREDLPKGELRELALRAALLCSHFEARLLINGATEIVRKIAREVSAICASGMHRKSSDITPIARGESFCGASVHSMEEARFAEKLGAKYLVFGSVFPTHSHPDSPAAGLETLREVCAATTLPVFAIGGINKNNARACLENGAYGVAVIRAVWNSNDVESATRSLWRAAQSIRPSLSSGHPE